MKADRLFFAVGFSEIHQKYIIIRKQGGNHGRRKSEPPEQEAEAGTEREPRRAGAQGQAGGASGSRQGSVRYHQI